MIWKGTHCSSIPTFFDRVIAMGNGGQKILRDSLDQNRYLRFLREYKVSNGFLLRPRHGSGLSKERTRVNGRPLLVSLVSGVFGQHFFEGRKAGGVIVRFADGDANVVLKSFVGPGIDLEAFFKHGLEASVTLYGYGQ